MITVNADAYGCHEMEQLMFDYVEGDLDRHIVIALDNHMMACQHCEDLVEGYRTSVEAARRTIPRLKPIPDRVRTEVLELLTCDAGGDTG